MTKPIVFISHAHTDAAVVGVLKTTIEDVFANGVDVFATAIPGVIEPGEDWFDAIRNNLGQARVALFLITPDSVNRPWLWFEMGASWENYLADKVTIIPVCFNVALNHLPPPLSAIQSLSLTDTAHAKLLFNKLLAVFGFGRVTQPKIRRLVNQLLRIQTALAVPPQTPTETVAEYQDRLSQALRRLIAQNVLKDEDMSIFSTYDLLPLSSIRQLRKP